MSPKISVILSVYNGEKYIKEAVQSILDQTYGDFECIIIDDGSFDGTAVILDDFTDSRIVRIKNEKNYGLVQSLNRGLQKAKGEYIARMDADDISTPERFAQQIAYLEMHPEVGVLGTAMRQIDTYGKVLSTLRLPETHLRILWAMCFGLGTVHASVMMRRSIVQEIGGYNETFLHVEDTELWSRLIQKTHFHNLPAILYVRRLHASSIISTQATLQRVRDIEIRQTLLRNMFGIDATREALAWCMDPSRFLTSKEKENARKILTDLYDVFMGNKEVEGTDKEEIENDFKQRMVQLQSADKHRLLKACMQRIKKSIPAPLRHALRTSLVGEYIFGKK